MFQLDNMLKTVGREFFPADSDYGQNPWPADGEECQGHREEKRGLTWPSHISSRGTQT